MTCTIERGIFGAIGTLPLTMSGKKSTLGVGLTNPPPMTALGFITLKSKSNSSANSQAFRSLSVFAIMYGEERSVCQSSSVFARPLGVLPTAATLEV